MRPRVNRRPEGPDVRTTSPLHALTWLVWAAAAAACVQLAPNPLYVALVLAIAALVVSTHRLDTQLARAFPLLVGLGAGLFAVYAPRSIMRRLLVLVLLVMAQGLLGAVQFFTGVPAVLVAFHVAGAAACTAATAALWASMRQRAEPKTLEG